MSEDGLLTLSVTTDASGHVVIAVQGEIDLSTAVILQRAIVQTIESADCGTVIVDLGAVSFIDSSGLKALLIGRRDLAQHDIGLVVRNPQPQARRLFEVALGTDQFEEVPSA